MNTAVSGSRVFISYRRGGGADIARVIEAFLDAQGFDVFLDVDSLGGGHFDEQILRQIEERDVFVLICNPRCFDRCDDPGDWVRRELEHALALGKRIVPVMTKDFEWPPPDRLPESIRAVARHNAFEYIHSHWKQTRSRLLQLLDHGSRRSAAAVPRRSMIVDSVETPATVETDSQESREFATLLAAAERGDADAQRRVGHCFADGRGVQQNWSKAVHWSRLAAEQGNSIAQFNIAQCYANGTGLPTDEGQAFGWFRKSAEQGYVPAQNNLGYCYYFGKGVSRDLSQASLWFGRAAKAGDAEAQFNLAKRYAAGEGVPKDLSQALLWLRRSAEQGLAYAQHDLAVKYFTGSGIRIDPAEGVDWYRKAANQGLADSQCGLATCYATGDGVRQDLGEAVAWYRKAAEQGLDRAQYFLAECLSNGWGVERDLTAAEHWYRKAAKQGYEDAIARLEA